jgi:hypothetical protein
MTAIIPLWAWMGTIYLIILTFQDILNKMYVDDRFNYLMMGLSISLLSYGLRNFWYILTIIVVIVVLRLVMQKYRLIGAADINTFMWLFFGYAYISLKSIMAYFVVFVFMVLLYNSIKYTILKKLSIRTPFYIAILLSYILCNILMGYYI